METIHLLILLHQVVSHLCHGISDTSPGHQDFLDDVKHSGNVRSILHVVPYPELIKWKSNLSRILPGIKKDNTAPIAIILAPSNIAENYLKRNAVPGLGKASHHLETYSAGNKVLEYNGDHTFADEREEEAVMNFDLKSSHNSMDEVQKNVESKSDVNIESDLKSSHNLMDDMKLDDVKSHEYTQFVLDKTLNNDDNNESQLKYKMLAVDSPSSSVENRKEHDTSDDDESKTDEANSGERNDMLQTILKHSFTLESNSNDATDFNTKKENFKIEHEVGNNLDIDIRTAADHKKTEIADFDPRVDKEVFEKYSFFQNKECRGADGKDCLKNRPYSIFNLLFQFHR